MIDKIFQKYGLSLHSYEIVPNIAEWCDSRGIPEINPTRAAKCLCGGSDGAVQIIFREEQTDDMISSCKAVMECDGFASEVERLNSDIRYLEHLVLHEIACHVLGTTEQKPRDEWAFKEMEILPCKADRQ